MARLPSKTTFIPKNPQKYIGKYPITSKSGWENSMMLFFDAHPNVISWCSESLTIPYVNPLTGKSTYYIPDFIVVYQDKDGKQHGEMIEIKPAKESPLHESVGRVSQHTKLMRILNAAKWQAAAAYCARNGLFFRILTENEMFGKTKRKQNR